MTLHHNLLPDPAKYPENQGLTLNGPPTANWKTMSCNFIEGVRFHAYQRRHGFMGVHELWR
jgi:hypothetical protein